MIRQNNNTKINKLAACSKAWLLLSMLFLMPIITQAANWPVGHLNTNATYHIYSAGDGYKFKLSNDANATVYEGLGWLVVSGGATVNIVFHTTAPVGVSGGLKVDSGTLNFSLASDYAVPAGQPTLVRWTAQALFHVCSSGTYATNIDNAKLNITGLSNKQFIIDGAANITYSGGNESGWSASNTGTFAKDPLLLLMGGKATLNYVDLRNNWFCKINGNSDYNFIGEGAAIYVTTNNYADPSFSNYGTENQQVWNCNTHNVLTATNTNISKCVSNRWGAAISLQCPLKNGNASSVSMTDCKIEYCFNDANVPSGNGPGGIIRGLATSLCSLEMTRCKVRNNVSQHICGGIWWESAMAPAMRLTNCEIDNNYGLNSSGGLYLVSTQAILTGCKIRNNYTTVNGGGLSFGCFGGPATGYLPTNYTPLNGSITLDANTEITGNHAGQNGGGMYIDVAPMNLAYGYGSEPAASAWCVFYNGTTQEQYKINIDLNGGTVSNNYAGGNGGGVYLQRNTDIYQTNVRLNWGKVENNTAAGYGGACFVQSAVTSINYYLNSSYPSLGYNGANPFVNDSNAIKMDVALGASSASGNLSFIGNEAMAGGGVFVNVNHNTSVTNSVLYTKVYGNSIIGNAAKPNVANNGNGGAILVNGGEVQLYGGTITNNTATANGGGIYFESAATIKVGTGSLTVKDNTTNTFPNNIYLPTGKTIDIMSGATFTPVNVGVYTQNNTRPVAVIAGNISDLASGTKDNVHDDKLSYGTTLSDKLYFGGSPWSPLQQTTTTSDLHLVNGVYEISNVKELTAFLWHVNGITTHGDFGSGDASAKGKLTADIDMDGHYWVPIANYTGTFDGNGYSISNLTMVPSNPSTERGLFGVNTSGTIKNVILKDCHLGSSSNSYLGCIVSQMGGGTLSNSMAEGTLVATNSTCSMGGLVGRNAGTVHSCYALPDMKGYTMGGLVGNNSGNLLNSFTNPSFDYKGASKYCGGLVGVNTGTVENCYVRLQGSAPASNFGWLVGNNDTGGTVTYCYAPTGATPFKAVGNAPTAYGTYGATVTPYLYNHRDNQVTLAAGPYTYVSNDASDNNQMLFALNKWVTAENTKSTPRAVCSYWLRPTTKVINDDLPLLRMTGTNAVAATDGAPNLDYNQVNDLLTGYKAATQAICLYGNESAMATNDGISSSAELYIDQEASMKPASTSTVITGHTSQWLLTYENAEPVGNRWHFLCSPLKESKIGFVYAHDANFSWSPDPCGLTYENEGGVYNQDELLFPSNTPVASFDLYSFYEPEYHWINFKRNSNSHWHENDPSVKINYYGNGIEPIDATNPSDPSNGNEEYLVPGKGYLVSIDVDQLLQNKGELNNGSVTLYSVTKTDYNTWAERLGFNLLGNPYQSYLDFEAFSDQNGSSLWSGTSEYTRTYATYEPSKKSYVQYKNDVSYGALAASQYIHPHQGFFIKKTASESEGTTVTYTNDMRIVSLPEGISSAFRGGHQLAYPLINFVVRDSEGNGDVAVLELDRDTDEGAEKMRLGECKGLLSLGYEGEEYGILFRSEIGEYQSLHFTAKEEGTFTLSWEPMNGEFSELTLVDNIAGTRTDMLGRDCYVFEGNPDQYASRFKIMIGDFKDIEEHEEDPELVEGPTFAFQMGNELVVNGGGRLEVIDMLGRIVRTEQLQGSQSSVRKPETAGVYVLRLTGRDGVRTQKIVIR